MWHLRGRENLVRLAARCLPGLGTATLTANPTTSPGPSRVTQSRSCLPGLHPLWGYGEAGTATRKKGGVGMELFDAVLSVGMLLMAYGFLFTAGQ
jgi:hypothetical protein